MIVVVCKFAIHTKVKYEQELSKWSVKAKKLEKMTNYRKEIITLQSKKLN